MLEVSMIAPFQVFKEASSQSDFDMTLAHLFKKCKHSYLDVLSKTQTESFMLDNSFFELGEPLPLEDMLAITEDIGVKQYFKGVNKNPFKVLILPDGDFGGFEVVKAKGFIPMLVPTNQEELFVAFYLHQKFASYIKVGISCIHAQKSQNMQVFDPNTRISFVENVLALFGKSEAEKIRKSKCLHFLGLSNEPWKEIKNLAFHYEATLDSSAFCWPYLRAKLDIRDIREKYKKPVDFNADFSQYEVGDFRAYIIDVRKALNLINEEVGNGK